MYSFVTALMRSIHQETWAMIIGDIIINFAFLFEGIAIIHQKKLSKESLFSYLLFTIGSFMWFFQGLIVGKAWIILTNSISVIVQISVLVILLQAFFKKNRR